MGRAACLNCACGGGVCKRVQMGQVPPLPVNLDVLLGPIVPPDYTTYYEPVFKTTVPDLAPRDFNWLWLAGGALALFLLVDAGAPQRKQRKRKAEIRRRRVSTLREELRQAESGI